MPRWLVTTLTAILFVPLLALVAVLAGEVLPVVRVWVAASATLGHLWIAGCLFAFACLLLLALEDTPEV